MNADFGFLFIEEEEESNGDRLKKKKVVVGCIISRAGFIALR